MHSSFLASKASISVDVISEENWETAHSEKWPCCWQWNELAKEWTYECCTGHCGMDVNIVI